MADAKYIVPERLKGKTVWMKPRLRNGSGRFDLDKCSQKDLAYLHRKGIDIEVASD